MCERVCFLNTGHTTFPDALPVQHKPSSHLPIPITKKQTNFVHASGRAWRREVCASIVQVCASIVQPAATNTGGNKKTFGAHPPVGKSNLQREQWSSMTCCKKASLWQGHQACSLDRKARREWLQSRRLQPWRPPEKPSSTSQSGPNFEFAAFNFNPTPQSSLL